MVHDHPGGGRLRRGDRPHDRRDAAQPACASGRREPWRPGLAMGRDRRPHHACHRVRRRPRVLPLGDGPRTRGASRAHDRRHGPSVVVGSELPVHRPARPVQDRERAPHSRRRTRSDRADDARRHSQLLGAATSGEDRPHPRRHERDTSRGEAARDLPRDLRRILRGRAREDGDRGHRRRLRDVPPVGTAAVDRRRHA